jgi:cytoskeletal protein CcmA (bactofilin family)
MARRTLMSIVTSSVVPLRPPRDPRPLTRLPAPEPEPRTLIIGPGISVRGIISDAERLIVEGTVEVPTLSVAELRIAQGGTLKGRLEVEDADIRGVMDGVLTVKGGLVVRSTGQIIGEARCRRLQVEDGGQLRGTIGSIGDAAAPRRDRFPTQRSGRLKPVLAERRGVETSTTEGPDRPLITPVDVRPSADSASGVA